MAMQRQNDLAPAGRAPRAPRAPEKPTPDARGPALALAVTLILATALPSAAAAQPPAMPMPIEIENSAEFRWLNKPVLQSRALDDGSDPDAWRFTGTGRLTFRSDAGPAGDLRALRVDVDMFRDAPAPTRNGLSSVNLRRVFPGEDWGAYNRISLWVRPDVSGFPMLPLQIVLHNEGRDTVPDAYYRDGIHYVTLQNGRWQRVVWEIEPLARDRVTAIEIGRSLRGLGRRAGRHRVQPHGLRARLREDGAGQRACRARVRADPRRRRRRAAHRGPGNGRSEGEPGRSQRRERGGAAETGADGAHAARRVPGAGLLGGAHAGPLRAPRG
jgi:hypothetical protein